MIHIKFNSSPDEEIIGDWKSFLSKVLIGKAKVADIIIDDPNLQKVHICLETTKEGLLVHGLSDQFHYYSNGKKVFGSKLHKKGDRVKLGETEFEIIDITTKDYSDYLEKISNAYESSITDSPEFEKMISFVEKELLWLEKEINVKQK